MFYLLMDLLCPVFLTMPTEAMLSVLQLSRDLLVSVDGGLAELEELNEVSVPRFDTSLSLSSSFGFSLDLYVLGVETQSGSLTLLDLLYRGKESVLWLSL